MDIFVIKVSLLLLLAINLANKKFNVDGAYRFATIEDFDAIITDSDIADEIGDKLKKLTVRLI